MRNRIRCDRTVREKVRWGHERKDQGKIWQGEKKEERQIET
jgi:hypothetical protein